MNLLSYIFLTSSLKLFSLSLTSGLLDYLSTGLLNSIFSGPEDFISAGLLDFYFLGP